MLDIMSNILFKNRKAGSQITNSNIIDIKNHVITFTVTSTGLDKSKILFLVKLIFLWTFYEQCGQNLIDHS